MTPFAPIIADVDRTYHDFARLARMTEWWHWMTFVLICGTVIVYVAWIYARDGVELRRGVAASLLLLRILAFGAILITFLGLEKRGETQITKPSRVVVLIDTSQSMGIHNGPTTAIAKTSRLEQVAAGLTQNKFISELRQKHHIVAYRFDQSSTPVQLASLPKFRAVEEPVDAARFQREENIRSLSMMRRWIFVATAVFATGIMLLGVYTFSKSVPQITSWLLCAG